MLPSRKKTLGGHDADLLAADIKNAIRLEMKVARSICSVGSLERFPIFYVNPMGDRSISYIPAFMANPIGAPLSMCGKRSKPPFGRALLSFQNRRSEYARRSKGTYDAV
jgi:hypothetical protein